MTRPRFLNDERGSTAAEFALVIPVALALVFGVIHMGLALYTATRLHWAVEDAARCASVREECQTNTGGAIGANATKVVNYAQSRYSGAAVATFALDKTTACGNKVTGTATYKLNAVVVNRDIDLSATACFPS